jgi:hypothetical protein
VVAATGKLFFNSGKSPAFSIAFCMFTMEGVSPQVVKHIDFDEFRNSNGDGWESIGKCMADYLKDTPPWAAPLRKCNIGKWIYIHIYIYVIWLVVSNISYFP